MISATALPRLPRVAPSEAIELNARLVALDTVNTELVPGAPGQRAAVELLVARLYYAGFEIEIVASPRAAEPARHGRGRACRDPLEGDRDRRRVRRVRRHRPSHGPHHARTAVSMPGARRREVAKNVARKSGEIAHELPSAELVTCAAAAKPLQVHTTAESASAREDSNP